MVRFGYTVAAALGYLTLLGPAAHAGLTIRVTRTGGGTLTVQDNMTGDTDPTAGSIKVAATGANSIAGVFGTYLAAGSSFDASLTTVANTVQLDNTSRLTLLGGKSATFTVEVTRDGLAVPVGKKKVVEASGSGNFNIGGTPSKPSTQQFTLGADGANTPFKITSLVVSTQTYKSKFAFGFGPFEAKFTDDNPYSLTNKAVYSITSAAGRTATVQSTTSQFVSEVPGPGVVAMVLGAIAPALAVRRLARRKTA